MKTSRLQLVYISIFVVLSFGFALASAADTNPPPRLTIELRDGSRVVGQSAEKSFKFHSALLGDLKLEVQDLRLIDCVSSNSMKLTAANGDVMAVQFAASELHVQTGFGKVELPVNSIRRVLVAAAGHPPVARPGLLAFWSGDGNAGDSAGHHNGVLAGGADFAPGPLGQAFDFAAPGSLVKIPNSSDLNPGGQLTVEFWMNADAANAMQSYQGLVTSDFYACGNFQRLRRKNGRQFRREHGGEPADAGLWLRPDAVRLSFKNYQCRQLHPCFRRQWRRRAGHGRPVASRRGHLRRSAAPAFH